jgi:monoamine oxidase
MALGGPFCFRLPVSAFLFFTAPLLSRPVREDGMPRSQIFAQMRRALTEARLSLPGAPPVPERALTRRGALALMAATAAAACAPKPTPQEAAQPIAIIGAGTSGLVVAWRLALAGRKSVIYESSNRTGGRMFTLKNFMPDGKFCELGGELVDTNHEALIGVCRELGLEVQKLRPEGEEPTDIYDFRGKVRSNIDILDPRAQTGAFIPVARRIAADQAALLDAEENWTPRAHELDGMSLKTYLDTMRGEAEPWVLDFLALAYLCENGMKPEDQSALNLVDYIGADAAENFALYGDSDEANRIAGGNSNLPDTLVQRLAAAPLQEHNAIKLGHELASVTRSSAGFKLAFKTGQTTTEVEHPKIVFALPFTRLRTVAIDIGLSDAKKDAIAKLGYGRNSKLMVATKSRPWRDGAMVGLNVPTSGSIYSDRGFQVAWDTSAGQPGETGILTNFMADEHAMGDEASSLAALQAGLRTLAPTLASALTPETKASFFWPRHPHTLASYSAPMIGQYCGMIEEAGRTELDGAVLFAGEHTSTESFGFMNGAVDAGERTAKELLAQPAAA